ncbi:MAG: hypothetical protein KUL83_00210 [Lentimicrobium sp.]|nr:hypothetical protein [Lentimicrobium sp.]MDY0027371.1 hypothetical protein [Lentimicrobium sp.]HAH59518.1 hypothetical protein [Bacteroidales bacterium]
MKTLYFFILIIFTSSVVLAQNDLLFSFNSMPSGRNVVLGYSKTVKNIHTFGIGLRININSKKHPDDQGNVFYKRLFATEFSQYFGVQANYYRAILPDWQCIKPYLFYDLQFTRSTTWNRFFTPYSYDINGDVLYKEYREYFGPFYWIEQSVGLGYRVKVANSLYMFQKVGAGITFILGEDKRMPQTTNKFSREFGYLLNIGVSYRLGE